MTAQKPIRAPSAAALRAAFDGAEPYTVGIEDEVMLVDPETFELSARAPEVIDALHPDPRFKPELPASQLEIVTPPQATVAEAAAELLEGRRELSRRTAGQVRLIGTGVHPTSPGDGELSQLERYRHTIHEYGPIARRQLVSALQVHVSVGDADRALAVYNAARSYLPWIAALAANAPFYEGRDTGFASIRPKLCQLLPRQGVPPVIDSWEQYASTLAWGAAAGTFPDAGAWWWELRLHRRYGTLEFRVPDGQSSVADAAALAAVLQALTRCLGERHDRGELLAAAPRWQIEENRWSAARHGVEGTMADLTTGEPRPTRACLEWLLATLEPHAAAAGAAAELRHAASLIALSGARAQRLIAADGGPSAVAPWLAERFLEPLAGVGFAP